jgi:ATP-dependent protease ClpP protease subunit
MKLITAIMALTFSLTTFAFPRQQILLTENNSVIFNQQVKDDYVAKKEFEIATKVQNLSKSQPLYLVLDTPGGSVMAGNQFIDFVKALNHPVHTVVIFAASMGYQITQELGLRYIIPSGTLMSHRGAVSGLSGQVPGELNARLQMLEAILDGMNERASRRVGMSKKDYQDAIINELWVSGDVAVSKGHADHVASAKCDSSLSGTYTEEFATIFGPVQVEFSKCPLISTPVGFKIGAKNLAPNSIGAGEVMKILTNRKIKLEF